MITVGPVPFGAPPEIAEFLTQLRQAVMDLQEPQEPVPVWECAQAELPAAADYPNRTVLVSDIPTLAISRLSGSTWAWVRADGSAL